MQSSDKRVTIEPTPHVRVDLAGKAVAETTRGNVVHESGLPDRYYVPRGDVTAKISEGHGDGRCPWKGHWKHLDVEIDGKRIANGAWTYDEPTQLGEPLRGQIAFYEDKFQISD